MYIKSFTENKMKILDLFNRSHEENNKLQPAYIIAEAGVNHEGDMELAKRLIREAEEGGAHAIKFQTYKADTIASKNSPAYWDLNHEPTDSQHKLFQKYDKFWKKEFGELKKYCDEVGIEFMSTPFDVESVIFLNEMMDVFKISSSDITNKPFIELICDFGKPIILSTGASTLDEIQDAVSWVEAKGNKLSLLHCILNYPTEDKNAHLGMIKDLQQKFPKYINGYSDHTLPKDMKVMEMATILGCQIIEKHFTHDKTLPGNDHYHAMDKEDLKLFHKNMERIYTLIGLQEKVPIESEGPARREARRSLVLTCDLAEGSVITREHLTWKRPAHGVSPKDIDLVLRKTLTADVKEDDLVQWTLFE